MSESENTKENFFGRKGARFWICFAMLWAAIFAFHGKRVPFSNELVYLLRLAPNFLPHDWTFSQAANEHWLFNFLFGLPVNFLPLEVVGWLGRAAVWSLCLIAIIKLGRLWKISFIVIGGGVFLWLAVGQSIVGGEWVFGGFEAKTVAYVCLLFALNGFAERKTVLPAILLGLAFAFHPAVGLWAILAVGAALLWERTPLAELLKIGAFVAVCALPGVLATLFGGQADAAGAPDDWRFIVTVRAPSILDPFAFSRNGVPLLFLMFAFNVFALWRSEDFALRFLVKFQTLLAAFFVFGFVLRWLELFSLLRLMPTRLFPVFTFLFFLFTIARIASQCADWKYKIAVVALPLLFIVVLLNPFVTGINQIRETHDSLLAAPDDLQKSFRWIAQNAPPDALVVAPPNRRDIWFETRRAAVASFAYPTYDRLAEWRSRVADLSGGIEISGGEQTGEQLENAFNNLTAEQISVIKSKYAATHLVSRAVYSYPIIFETETYKIYRLF